jgi:plastocyanin
MPSRRNRTRFVVAAFAVATIALGPSGTAQAAIAATFRGSGTSWSPTRVTINAGQTVRWKAVSGTHTVTAYGGNWSKNTVLSAGETTRRTFTNTGVYKFLCTIHGNVSGGVCTGMCGRVRVT